MLLATPPLVLVAQAVPMFDQYVDPDEFPAWFYAEIEAAGGEKRVVSLFHVLTPVGNVVYWYDDSENPQRTMPLLSAMRPINLGDYGGFLQQDDNMSIFVALCKALQDLPDPLQAVQAIHWIVQRNLYDAKADLNRIVLQALHSTAQSTKQRRSEFEYMMRVLAGVGSTYEGSSRKTASA